MDTRTGVMPVGALTLVLVLTILSIRAWQGADLATEITQMANSCTVETLDRNLAALRQNVRVELGLESPLPATAYLNQDKNGDDSEHDNDNPSHVPGLAGSDFVEPVIDESLVVADNDEQFVPVVDDSLKPESQVIAREGLLAVNPIENLILDRKSKLPEADPIVVSQEIAPKVEPVLVPNSDAKTDRPSIAQATTPPEIAASTSDVATSQVDQQAIVQKPFKQVSSRITAPASLLNKNQSNRSQTKETESRYPQWSRPVALIERLEEFYSYPVTLAWAQDTVRILESLTRVEGLADSDSKLVFTQLQQQVGELDPIMVQVSTIPVNRASAAQGTMATELRQLRYSIMRRLDVWPLVHKLCQYEAEESIDLANHQVGQFLLASNARLNASGLDKGWSDYLQMEQAAAAFNSLNPKPYAKKKAARFVLARLFSPSLSKAQQEYLRDTIDQETVDVLRISAIDEVDLEKLVQLIERLEDGGSGVSQFYVNDIYQNLYWSDNQAYHELAGKLDTHYRNANFRVSVSEELLNRMMPQLPDTREPYRDRFMGADLVGQNRISNSLAVNLIPDPNQISMQVVTDGRVRSRTTATRSGIVVENEGTSRFRIIKRLAFGQQGIFAYRPETTSQVANRVVGLRSNLDNVPAVGWLVRKIAKNKLQEQAPVSSQYAKNQLESKAEEKFEKEIEQKLVELESTLTNNLLHPLIAMDLEPDPVQISTTADRINMRYRLAGRDQMSARTARPRAINSCLMSMQIHQSVINNFVSRFDLAGKKFTTNELITYVNEIMGQQIIAPDESKKKEAELEFAPFDPIRFDFEDGQIQISLNLKSFKIGKGKKWRNLTLKATYDTQVVNGFNVALYQGDEKLKIKGRRMNAGDTIAVGFICEVLFPEELQVALMPSQLASKLKVSSVQTTQFVVSEGWIGISVDDANRQQIDRGQQADGRPTRERALLPIRR